MKFPIFYATVDKHEKGDFFPDDTNYRDYRRMLVCLYHLTVAILCRLQNCQKRDDIKLTGIAIYDCHNEVADFYSITIGVSSGGWATQNTSFTVPSDTLNMRKAFKKLFENFLPGDKRLRKVMAEDCDNMPGIYLNLDGRGRHFLEQLYFYWRKIYSEIKDEPIVNQYAYINKYGIPVTLIEELLKELDEFGKRFLGIG